MKTTRIITGSVGLSAALAVALGLGLGLNHAEAQSGAGNQVMRMLSHGSDGEVKWYHVRCADGSEGNVKVVLDEGLVCASPVGKEQQCSTLWTLREAGQRVCNAR